MTKHFTLVVFTASLQEYADEIINIIDPTRIISKRFYRHNCYYHETGYIKDLSKICKNYKDAIMVDDSTVAISVNRENSILVSMWNGNMEDYELMQLKDTLLKIINGK